MLFHFFFFLEKKTVFFSRYNRVKKLTHFPLLPDHAACTICFLSRCIRICQAPQLQAKLFVVQAPVFG